MRYSLSALVLALVALQALPAAAWLLESHEAPAESTLERKKRKKQEKLDDFLVGRWFDKEKEVLVTFTEGGYFVESHKPVKAYEFVGVRAKASGSTGKTWPEEFAGKTWMAIRDPQASRRRRSPILRELFSLFKLNIPEVESTMGYQKGVLRIAELGFEPTPTLLCGYKILRLDKKGNDWLKLETNGGSNKHCGVAGTFRRVQYGKNSALIGAWLEERTGRVIELTFDEYVIVYGNLEQVVLPGTWAVVGKEEVGNSEAAEIAESGRLRIVTGAGTEPVMVVYRYEVHKSGNESTELILCPPPAQPKPCPEVKSKQSGIDELLKGNAGGKSARLRFVTSR